MSDFINSRFNQFEMIVEQFEVCRNLIKEKSAHKARICIILLDNIAEILILRILLDKCDWFNEPRWIIEPDFSIKDKINFQRYFDSKIDSIKKLNIINSSELEIISICHKYRNLAFHTENYNPSTINLFSKLLFSSTLSLFIKSQDTVTQYWSNKKIKWLSKYSLQSDHIDYISASKQIVNKIGLKRKPTITYIKRVLHNDLIKRTTEIHEIIKKIFDNITNKEKNNILKYFEFELFNQELIENISKDFRQIRYLAGKGQLKIDKSLKMKYKSTEKEFYKSYEIETDKYKQHITINRINNFYRISNKLNDKKTVSEIIHHYHDFDMVLSQAELIIDTAYRDWDFRIQREIDLRRGK